MNRNTRYLAAIAFGILALLAACKKKNANRETTCMSTLHAYNTAVNSADTATFEASKHGMIDLATGTITTTSSIFRCSPVFTNQGAFNTADNCYYVFKANGLYPSSVTSLYKIGASGTVTLLSATDTVTYTSLVYNDVTHNLYCIRNGVLVEISIAGTTFTTTSVATLLHPLAGQLYTPAHIAVDLTSGDMYFTTGDTTTYYIEKYHAGYTTSAVVATGTNGRILEMRFNFNDHMLYAMKAHGQTSYDFIKINPAGSSITTIAVLGFQLNPDFYSATLDQCNNRYIIFCETHAPFSSMQGILRQINMSGAVVQSDSTTTYYQGLTAIYWPAI